MATLIPSQAAAQGSGPPERTLVGKRPQLRPWRIARFAWQNLVVNLRRTALALVGVAVGMAAITSLSLVSRSAQRMVEDSFAGLPLALVALEFRLEPATAAIDPVRPGGKQAPTRAAPAALRSDQDWGTLQQQMSELAAGLGLAQGQVSSVVSTNCDMLSAKNKVPVPLVGTDAHLLNALGVGLVSGRALHPLDGTAPWVLMGDGLAERLRGEGTPVTLGQPLLVCGNTVYLAGVMAKANFGSALLGMSLDDGLVMLTDAWRRTGNNTEKVVQLWRLADESQVQPTLKRLGHALQAADAQTRATVRSSVAMIELKRGQVGQNARLAGVLIGISLLVGGVGIMNVMLVATMERRHDIAICMALGADRLAIGWQFLVESALLGVLGGAVGLVVGWVLGGGVLAWLDMPWQPDVAGAALSLLMGAVLGAVSGLYPALKVSRLDCAEVLAS